MHKELKATDIQFIADGYWRHYFRHRDHNPSTIPLVVGVVTGLTGLVLLVIALALVPHTPPILPSPATPTAVYVVAGVGVILLVVGLASFVRSGTKEKTENEAFLEHILDKWDDGDKDIPDIDAVAEYLKNRELVR